MTTQRLRFSRRFHPGWVALALSCALPATAQTVVPAPSAAAPAAAQPGAVELEFWRSAERLGTADAYRAYLAAFPQGLFAPLARAAISQVSAATSPAPPSTALRHFNLPAAQSGAVEFRLGDRFTGPGFVTVGWSGAKRQMVVPPGEWVVLAMVDSKVDITPPAYRFPTRVVADIGNLVLGRFSGTRLAAAMVYQSSVRPITVDDWPDLAGCQAASADGLFQETTRPSGLRTACAALKPVPAPLDAKTAVMEEARASLARLGAQVQGDALATVAVVMEPRRGFLAGTRLDWPGVALGTHADTASAWTRNAAAQDPTRAAMVASLIEWLGHYRKVLDNAYGFRIDLEELKAGAGVPPPSNAIKLPDFQPGR